MIQDRKLPAPHREDAARCDKIRHGGSGTAARFPWHVTIEVFAFRSGQNPRLLALTRFQTGANLPERYGPWHPEEKQNIISLTDHIEPSHRDILRRAIEEKGFYLARSDGLPW